MAFPRYFDARMPLRACSHDNPKRTDANAGISLARRITPGKEGAMIARHWRGLVKPDQAQAYARHLRADTLPALRALPGFIGASVLSRRLAGGTEFLVITRWGALEDIARFSGPDLEAAVVPAAAAQMMVDYDRRATHYEVMD
jgi:heme-degrading monooxygenase HmoA